MSKVNSTWYYVAPWYYKPMKVLEWRLKSLMYRAISPERGFYPRHSPAAMRDAIVRVPAGKPPAPFPRQKTLGDGILQG